MKEAIKLVREKIKKSEDDGQKHESSEAWPEQKAHKHVTLQSVDTGEIIYVTQKDKGTKILRLLQKGWEIIERED